MDFRELTDADFVQAIAATQGGLVLYYKKLCPHCQNIKKVIEKFVKAGNDVAVMMIDIEEQTKAAEAHEVTRAPTTLVIKEGKIATVKLGLFNPRELAKLYKDN